MSQPFLKDWPKEDSGAGSIVNISTDATLRIQLRPRNRMGRLEHTSSPMITHSLNVVQSLGGK